MSHDYKNSTATYYACIVYVRMECMARKLLRGDDPTTFTKEGPVSNVGCAESACSENG